MQRITTATKVVDKFGAGKHGFTDGNVVGGVPSTDMEAALFDNIQEEIAAVVEASGQTLNGGVMNQLLLALRNTGVFTTPTTGDRTTKAATTAMFGTEFAFSASPAGYQKLPSGILLQWGMLADASWVANTFRNVSYPITFPGQVLQHCAVLSNSAGTIGRVNTNQLSTSQLQLAVDYAGSATVRWIAIGY